jgi:CRP/FNR family transcriptional regulator, cyclic AMP receptor protein
VTLAASASLPYFWKHGEDEHAAHQQQQTPARKGEAGDCMYIVQSGTIDMMIGDAVIETIGANEALGFMSMIDEMPRSSTACAREDCELFLIDARTFRFMVDEVPNFSTYIMRVLARRIRGMSKAI